MPKPLIRFEQFERRGWGGTRYYFRIVRDGNNEILAPSQAYKSPTSRDTAINLIKLGAQAAPIVRGVRK